MNMRLMMLFLLGTHAFVLRADELSRETAYRSLEEFRTDAKAFHPDKSPGEFQKLFSIPELRERGKHGPCGLPTR